jgi:hypothetical protein
MVGAKLLISSEMGPVDLASPDSPIKIKREDGDLHYVNAPLGWAVGTMGSCVNVIYRQITQRYYFSNWAHARFSALTSLFDFWILFLFHVQATLTFILTERTSLVMIPGAVQFQCG